MSFDADAAVDRRRLKRRLGFWRVLAILALIAVVAVATRHDGGFGFGDRRHIARFAVEGIIVGDRQRESALHRLADSDQVAALIIHIDSPGGTMVGGETLYRALRSVAAQKPVVAVMGEVATSAGYMIAIAADRVFSHSGTVTGSIGVIWQTANVTGLLEKIGVSTEAIKSGPLKAVPSPLEPTTSAARAVTRGLVDDGYRFFLELVAERRGLGPDRLAKLADGRVYTGRQAVANDLVDAIGGEAEAIAWLKLKGVDPALPVRDIAIGDANRFWRELMSTLAGKTFFSERLTLDGLVSLWHPA